MRPIKIHLIAGARPNFMKIAALWRAFKKFKGDHPQSGFNLRVINTGQHYDYLLSGKIFQDLNLPKPDFDLGVGSHSHAVQTARIMSRYEPVLLNDRPHLVIVAGDVNSTLACSLVAGKMEIPVAHVEAGLRSFDPSMPEEINRRLTDTLSEYLFTPSEDAGRNLLREGISRKKIFFVGNVMVDTLLVHLKRTGHFQIRKKLGLNGRYGILTLHRPANVDRDADFQEILGAVEKIQRHIPIVFPVHPRTAGRLRNGPLKRMIRHFSNVHWMPPLGYLDFIHLLKEAALVLTDSGGIQEEATVLGIPCLTLRDNTERPITLRQGTNVLAGRKARRITRLAFQVLENNHNRQGRLPKFWDGRAAERIVRILSRKIGF